jgi:hypothetical protein
MIKRFLKWIVRALLAEASAKNAYESRTPAHTGENHGERDEAERDEAERDERAERNGHVEGNENVRSEWWRASLYADE